MGKKEKSEEEHISDFFSMSDSEAGSPTKCKSEKKAH